jgi:hypothetical protein
MNERKTRIAFVSVALGMWMIAFPLTFEFQGSIIEWSDIASGCLLVIFGLLSLKTTRVWSGWAIGLVGVWLQLAPLIFWAKSPLMYVNDTMIGAIAIVFSFLFVKKEAPSSLHHCPTGWSFNPSGWSLRIPTIGLAFLCWFFTRYMTAFQLGYIDQIWDPFFERGTLDVITSQISKDFPVSDAGLGTFGYTLEALLGWQGNSRRWATMPWLVTLFGFLVIPVSVASITLIILQPVVVGAWCSWCLATACVMLVMIVLTAAELAATCQLLIETKRKGHSVWTVFWKGEKVSEDGHRAKHRGRAHEQFAWGITLPWNLVICAALGVWLMFSPSLVGGQKALERSNYILGPMVATFSVIAFAEVFRSVRFLNLLFGAGLIVAAVISWSNPLSWNNLVVGALVIALTFRQGTILERYGPWEKLIH